MGDQKVYGLVIRTGYVTTKGTLVRDILYPRASNLKFYKDALIFVGAMAVVSLIGFAITFPTLIKNNSTDWVINKCLDMVTICVPPALPATLSVGVSFAISRLKKSKIFCISPQRVNVTGMIQMMVFDKTGTLTEDGLELKGLRTVSGRLGEMK